MTPAVSPVPRPPIVEEVAAAVVGLGLAARGADLDRAPEFPRREFRGLGERHLLGLRIATPHGGRG
jgi:alkylation response protein AidB-like acyl-CoA dehydrogenase